MKAGNGNTQAFFAPPSEQKHMDTYVDVLQTAGEGEFDGGNR